MLGWFFLASFIGLSIPEKPIAPNAIEIYSEEDKSFLYWTEKDLEQAYDELQKLILFWKHEKSISQYLIYATLRNKGSSSFQVAPFVDAHNFFTRFSRQFRVLWRVSFGKSPLTIPQKKRQEKKYLALLKKEKRSSNLENHKNLPSPSLEQHSCDEEEKIHNTQTKKNPSTFCAFCDKEIITKQQVFEGKKARVLYNYDPLGTGKERLHFLVIPKRHARTNSDLTKEEYVEAFQLAQKIVTLLEKTREIANVHFLYKCGKDAGQSIPHWHLHVIVQLHDLEGTLGKIKILKNMTFGRGAPLSDKELQKAVDTYSAEFLSLQ